METVTVTRGVTVRLGISKNSHRSRKSTACTNGKFACITDDRFGGLIEQRARENILYVIRVNKQNIMAKNTFMKIKKIAQHWRSVC